MSAPDLGLFAEFTVLKDIEYGSIRSQPLPLDIILPRNIGSASGPRPVLLYIHGGALVAGQRDFQPWYSLYTLEWAAEHNAIFIAPDYPLAPESKTPEILASQEILMSWIQNDLQKTLDMRAPELNLKADIARLAAIGDSAGGWCVLQFGLRYPDEVRALALRFPMIDLEDRAHFNNVLHVPEDASWYPPPSVSIYDEHVADMVPGKIVTSGASEERLTLGVSAICNGRVLHAIGESDESFPLRTIARGGAKLPKRLWFFHGSDDTLVPGSGSRKAVKLIEEKVKGVEVKLDERPGDHAFDTGFSMHGEDPVVKQRLAWLSEEWLR